MIFTELCDIYRTMLADLAPDLMPVEQSFYETEVTEDATPDVGTTTDNEGDDQQLLAHLTHCKKLPPHDIQCILAT